MSIVSLKVKLESPINSFLSVNPESVSGSPPRLNKYYISGLNLKDKQILIDESVLVHVLSGTSIEYIVPAGTLIAYYEEGITKVAETAQPLLVTGPPITILMS